VPYRQRDLPDVRKEAFMNRVLTTIPAQQTGPMAGTRLRASTRLVISAT
jgi:hypothetical protein